MAAVCSRRRNVSSLGSGQSQEDTGMWKSSDVQTFLLGEGGVKAEGGGI